VRRANTSSKLKAAAQMHRLVVKISTLLARALGRDVLAFRRRCVNNAASAEPLVAKTVTSWLSPLQ
jgi:hypothetical protein